MTTNEPSRTQWLGRWGFVLAATGSAVGLGNIWKFPYMTGEYGGGAFVLVYLVCILSVGVPIMMTEIALGRRGRGSPIDAIRRVVTESGRSSGWSLLGWMAMLCGFLILSFYVVVAGWSFAYLWKMISGGLVGSSVDDMAAIFGANNANPFSLGGWSTLVTVATMVIVGKGVQQGIEKSVGWMMPGMVIMLLIMIVYGMFSGGFGQAVHFLFDFKASSLSSEGMLAAMGHAFFTLAVGACALMAYGAYMPDEQSLPKAAFAVAVLDISVALLAGIAIFSVVFAQGMDPADGPGLMFVTLPIAFSELPWGSLWLSVFFLLLLLATWTSAINLAEPMVATLQGLGWRRSVSTAVVAISVWLLGLLSAFSFSTLAEFRPLLGRNVFELVSSIPPDIFLPLGGLLIATFASWVMPQALVVKALGVGDGGYVMWRNIVRWVSIPLTFIVLLGGLL